jgi:hypothetical protein
MTGATLCMAFTAFGRAVYSACERVGILPVGMGSSAAAPSAQWSTLAQNCEWHRATAQYWRQRLHKMLDRDFQRQIRHGVLQARSRVTRRGRCATLPSRRLASSRAGSGFQGAPWLPMVSQRRHPSAVLDAAINSAATAQMPEETPVTRAIPFGEGLSEHVPSSWLLELARALRKLALHQPPAQQRPAAAVEGHDSTLSRSARARCGPSDGNTQVRRSGMRRPIVALANPNHG